MASTYTANNGIEKPSTGEQSGTWGDTTNINFDIIDRALNGVGAISLSGTAYTLQTSDGSLDEGHYKVLVLGGSPAGTCTVTISPSDQDKLYFIYNNSGESVVIQQGNGSGGTVTIANGSSKIVYADGAGTGAKVTDFTGFMELAGVVNATTFKIDGTEVTSTAAELNILDGVTASTAELNIMDGVTASTGELNILDGVTATTAEINILDGVTSNASEVNLLDGATGGSVVNGKAVVYDGSGVVAATTLSATTVDLGNWTITESAGVLYFATSGTNKAKLDASGNFTVTGNVTAYGTV